MLHGLAGVGEQMEAERIYGCGGCEGEYQETTLESILLGQDGQALQAGGPQV